MHVPLHVMSFVDVEGHVCTLSTTKLCVCLAAVAFVDTLEGCFMYPGDGMRYTLFQGEFVHIFHS